MTQEIDIERMGGFGPAQGRVGGDSLSGRWRNLSRFWSDFQDFGTWTHLRYQKEPGTSWLEEDFRKSLEMTRRVISVCAQGSNHPWRPGRPNRPGNPN